MTNAYQDFRFYTKAGEKNPGKTTQQGTSHFFSDPGLLVSMSAMLGTNSETKMYAFSILTCLHFGTADLYQVKPIKKQFPPWILYSWGIMEQISADPSTYKQEFRGTFLIKNSINNLPNSYTVLSTVCSFQLLNRWPHIFIEQCLI